MVVVVVLMVGVVVLEVVVPSEPIMVLEAGGCDGRQELWYRS